jgi:hypothetical protein
MPKPVAERSKTRVCRRSLSTISGSNPAGGMDVLPMSVVCCHVNISAAGRSLIQRSPTDFGVLLCAIYEPRE